MTISFKFQEIIVKLEKIIKQIDKYLIEIEKLEESTNGKRK